MKFKTMLSARLVAVALATTLLMATAWVPSLMAQSSGTGGLTGTVTDPSGAVVRNVTVTATNIATSQARTATTSADGSYRFSLLPPGNYKVRFSAKEFKTAEVPSVQVAVTETPVVNGKLELGAQSEYVTVQADAETIQTATSALGTLVGSETITSLPLTSRNYTQILGLSAGTSGSVNNAAALGRGTNNISVNGNLTGSNNVQMDGVAINNWAHTDTNDDGFYATGVAIPSPDAIQEFMVQTSTYDASYGRNPGANINVVTKSGTNQIHGTAFEFFRNAALNASEYFSKSNLLDQNQFGGTIGGPIKKDKLFFFASYQGTRQKNGIASGGLAVANLPGLTEDRSATGVANAVDPASGTAYCAEVPGISCDGTGVDPVALFLMQLKGGPTGSYLIPSGSGQTSYSNPARYTEDQFIGNVDYMLSAKNTLQARFLWSRNPQFTPFPNFPGGAGASLGDPVTYNYHNVNATLKLTSLVTNTFTNEARISYGLLNANIADAPVAGSAGLFGPGLMTGIVEGQTAPPLFWIGIGGTTTSLFSGFTPAISPVHQYQVADQIAWSHGNHTLRAGFEADQMQHNFNFIGFERGWLWFLNMGGFMTGQPFACIFCVTGAPGGVHHYYRVNGMDTFVQDDWRISPRLTFNLGLRWEYFGGPTDAIGNLTNLNPDLMNTVDTPTESMLSGPGLVGWVVPKNYPTNRYGAVPDGVQQTNTGYSYGNPPRSNFAPRFGFAWQPTNSGKLVVRGGFGMFYDRYAEDAFVHGVEQGPPYAATLDYIGVPHTLEDPFASNVKLGEFPARWSNYTCAPDGTECSSPAEQSGLSAPYISWKQHTPFVRQYNLNIQRELAPKFVLELAYVGSSGINLADQYHIRNVAQLASPDHPINGQIANTVANVPLRVPTLGYQAGGLQAVAFDGVMNYNSVQVTLRKQFSHGLQMQAAYTFGRALTTLQKSSSNFEFGANINNPDIKADSYGPGPQNIPQRFVVNYHYDLPFGQHAGGLGKLANGWSLSGVTIAQDGFPITVLDSAGGSIYGVSTSTAQLCPGMRPSQMLSSGSMQSRAANGYLNPAAFCNQPTTGNGTGFGNSPVGAVLGPGQFNWDMSLDKELKITERQSLTFRTEFYNAFNHTQFANPQSSSFPTLARGGGNSVAPVQGIISATTVNPRLIQFGLRYRF